MIMPTWNALLNLDLISGISHPQEGKSHEKTLRSCDDSPSPNTRSMANEWIQAPRDTLATGPGYCYLGINGCFPRRFYMLVDRLFDHGLTSEILAGAMCCSVHSRYQCVHAHSRRSPSIWRKVYFKKRNSREGIASSPGIKGSAHSVPKNKLSLIVFPPL